MKKFSKKNIKKEIKKLMEVYGPMIPGKMSEQFLSCGKHNCHCKQDKEPIKHGPYYQFAWSIKGKRSSMHVKASEANMIREIISRYAQFEEVLSEIYLEEIEAIKKKKKEK